MGPVLNSVMAISFKWNLKKRVGNGASVRPPRRGGKAAGLENRGWLWLCAAKIRKSRDGKQADGRP
jgi:hypothetical protein